MKKLKELSLLALSLVSLLAMATSPVFAAATTTPAPTSSGNGIKVSPVRTDLTLKPGNSQTVTVYAENVTKGDENLQVLVNDFQASNDESGTPALLLNGENAPQHGLKQFMTVPSTTITVKPGEMKAVPIVISIPANTPGGGYFGAVRFAPASAGSSKSVNLAASVASLILVSVPGNVTEQLSLASFQVQQGNNSRSVFTNGKNLQAVARFENKGNLQEEPFGKVLLKKGSKVVSTAEINATDPRGNVLPNSIRRFTVSLSGVGSFGKYTVEGNFGYGSKGQLLSAQTSFYVIPYWTILIVIAVLAVLLFLIFGVPRLIRRHDRRVLNRAGRR